MNTYIQAKAFECFMLGIYEKRSSILLIFHIDNVAKQKQSKCGIACGTCTAIQRMSQLVSVFEDLTFLLRSGISAHWAVYEQLLPEKKRVVMKRYSHYAEMILNKTAKYTNETLTR